MRERFGAVSRRNRRIASDGAVRSYNRRCEVARA